MKKGIFYFLFMGITVSTNAQEIFDASVFVSDFNDVPMSDAQVKLFDSTGTVYRYGGTTNDEGRFELKMSPGKYRIKLFQEGEVKKDKIINLPELEGRRIYHQVRIHVLYEERDQFTLENLLFEYNSAHIYEESYPILNKLVDYLLNEGESKFEIGGHTDNVGSEEDNLILSKNRANAVRDYLIAHGVNPDRLVAKGYGESVPVADNETENGRSKNRRTEIKRLE